MILELALEPCVADVILGHHRFGSPLRPILKVPMALERADFAAAHGLAATASIKGAAACARYAKAMAWADSLAL